MVLCKCKRVKADIRVVCTTILFDKVRTKNKKGKVVAVVKNWFQQTRVIAFQKTILTERTNFSILKKCTKEQITCVLLKILAKLKNECVGVLESNNVDFIYIFQNINNFFTYIYIFFCDCIMELALVANYTRHVLIIDEYVKLNNAVSTCCNQ